MFRMLRHRQARAAFSVAALAAFLLGTNYCVLSALVPAAHASGMSCHASANTPARGRCCQHEGHGKRASREPSSAMPCCMAATSPAGPALAKPVSSGFIAAFAAPLNACVESAAVTPSWHGPPPDANDLPQALLSRAPVASRAPPLA